MGILDNLLTPDTFDNLALGFNSMRLNPDENLPDMIARRQALRREAGNRQKAIDYFKNIPGSEAYIGALNAGGSGANLISNYIATLEQRKRDKLEHQRAMQRAAANRAPQGTATMQTVRSLIENGDLPKNTANNTAILDLIVPVTRGANGQVTNIGRPIQMPTAAKSPAINRQMTGAELAQNLMGTGSKSTAALVGQTPDKVFDVTIDNGTITNYTPALTTDPNKTIAMLQDAANNGDVLADSALAQIEADPRNASTILKNYYTTRSYMDRDAMTVSSTRSLGNGLVELIMKDGGTKYKKNGIMLDDPEEIQAELEAAKKSRIDQEEDEAAAKKQGQIKSKKIADIDAAIQGMNNSVAVAEQKIGVLMTHPGLEDAVGQVNGLKGKLATSKEGAEFITLYDELAGQIFLSAFEKLKGGGPITDLEGQKAQSAASNLDRQLDPDSFRRALNTFYNDLRASHARLVQERAIILADEGPAALPPAVDFNLSPDFD